MAINETSKKVAEKIDKKAWVKPVLYTHDVEQTLSGPGTGPGEVEGEYSPALPSL